MKILIVDDDPRLCDLLRLALERAGYEVAMAADGQSALMRVTREPPDLVVLDIGLPEVDGLEVCRRIRARSEVPILFLTARDDEIDASSDLSSAPTTMSPSRSAPASWWPGSGRS